MKCKIRPLFLFIYVKSRSFLTNSSGNFNMDIIFVNRLINEHSKNGDLFSAQKLFDEMPERDVVSWNSIITAHLRSGCYHEAVKIFSKMQRSSLKPNFTSLSVVLSSCASLRALFEGKQIHGLSTKLCSSRNVFVGTSLITMYSKCGVLDCLVRVLDDVDCPNIAAWNALISGFVLNRQISDARVVFDRMPNRNVISWTAMISGYLEAKKIRSAFELFESMPIKNVVSWTAMIGGLVSNQQFHEALQLFSEMMNSPIRATLITMIKVLSACSGLQNPEEGRIIHAYAIKFGFHGHQLVEASLVSMYCECLEIEEAKLEFDKMDHKSVGSWNSLICGYIDNAKVDEARILFDSMIEKDSITWNLMISGYVRTNRIDSAKDLFSKMPEATLEATTALMSCYIKNDRIEEARKLFDMMPQVDVTAYTTMIHGYMEKGMSDVAWDYFNKMPEKNVVTYTVMISGLLQHGKVAEAYALFTRSPHQDASSWNALIIGFVQNGLYVEAFGLYKEMGLSEMRPTELFIASLLRASARLCSLTTGLQIHNTSIKLGHDMSLVVANSLINLYSKCSEMSIARSIFDQMIECDVVTWNILIYGYASNGFGRNAINMFEKMKRMHVEPDHVTFTCVLSACTHDRLLEEAEYYFSSMECNYGIVPNLRHYACLIDLLGRMGMVEKAEKLVRMMPFEPDSAIWTSLLSGSRVNCDVKVAEVAASKLFAKNPTDPMPHLQLISIYGSNGRWNYVEKMRSHIKKNRLRSSMVPGCSWIEISELW